MPIKQVEMNTPITIINLARDDKKKTAMAAQCQSLGLEYQFFVAIDGRDLSQAEIDEIYDEKQTLSTIGRPLSHGEVGCALSHLGVYQKMITNNVEQMIILEDDAVLEDDFKKVASTIPYFPNNWDVVFLGYVEEIEKYKCTSQTKKILEWTLEIPTKRIPCTHAYLISQQGAKKLLVATQKLYQPIDHYTGEPKILNIYLLIPKCVQGNDGRDDSDLERDRVRLGKRYVCNIFRKRVKRKLAEFGIIKAMPFLDKL